ncbi:MAG: hypothetical protein HeimC2_07980 [Candidatus Heimdallarchaeota archaeon LC_2]|nr:MAG: hypothetical protein HeimC2_07980 [Candidatus Heimdallarchaeota archaeon LC_2]
MLHRIYINLSFQTFMPSTHIDHVIRRLEYVIQWSKKNNSRIGYFAALYERVTIEIDKNIDLKTFNYNDQMMRFDVIFAEYYLMAFESYMRGEPVSEVWKIAFDKTKDDRLSVIQHLLLGMNAHINLDLAVTVSNVSTPETLEDLKEDFFAINKILFGLVDLVEDQIGRIYKSLKFFDKILGRVDEHIVNKLMEKYRDRAWQLAIELTQLNGYERTEKILAVDKEIATFAENSIAKPIGTRLKIGNYLIRRKEANKIKEIIDILHSGDTYEKWDVII